MTLVDEDAVVPILAAASSTDDWQHVGPLKPAEQDRWLESLEREAGRRYVDCRLVNFDVTTSDQFYAVERCRDYVASIRDRVKGGESLLLMGPVGTGKDHLAFAVARGAIVRGYSAAWLDCLQWYARMRDRIKENRPESDQISALLQPSLLVLSDPLPPVGELSDYEASNLLRIVHGRYCEQKPTFVTANLANEDAGRDLIGDQAWDRLIDKGELIWCRWPSYRQQRPRAP